MKFLYIFPHPDDESFGPAGAIYQQVRQGHQVYLLTLTRGEATKIRFRLGLSAEEMGKVRLREMEQVSNILRLSGMEVWDLEDGELAHMDPIVLEDLIKTHVRKIKPDILVTYAIHGISGHPDHLAIHAVVKRVFCEFRRSEEEYVRRLAFFTLPREDREKQEEKGGNYQVNRSKEKHIDCVVELSAEDRNKFIEALDAYATFTEVINETGVKNKIGFQVHFEIFGEDHKPPLSDLVSKLIHYQGIKF